MYCGAATPPIRSSESRFFIFLKIYSKFFFSCGAKRKFFFFKSATPLVQNRLQASQIAINIRKKSREADVVNFAIESSG